MYELVMLGIQPTKESKANWAGFDKLALWETLWVAVVFQQPCE